MAFCDSASPRLAVTTGATASPQMRQDAYDLAAQLGAPFVPRRGGSIETVLSEGPFERLLVVESSALCLRDAEGYAYRFHPNMVLVRAMNLMRQGRDAFLDAAELCPGEHVLDCTLGFACEATLASFAVGETGTVTGLEAVPELAAVTRMGAARFPLSQPKFCAAMTRIVVLTANYGDYLRQAPDRSADLVYFDPFFEHPLSGSGHSISPLAHFGHRGELDAHSLKQARRVARRRVLLKHARFTQLPDELARDRRMVISSRKGSVAYSVYDPE